MLLLEHITPTILNNKKAYRECIPLHKDRPHCHEDNRVPSLVDISSSSIIVNTITTIAIAIIIIVVVIIISSSSGGGGII